MAAGRKPKAPHLKVVSSSKSPAPAPAKPADQPIRPPASMKLSKAAAARFRELVAEMDDAQIASATYRRLIAQVARAEETVATMREKIGEDWTVTVVSTQGEEVEKAHPLVAPLQAAETHLARLYAAAGLTPADIGKAPRTKGVGDKTPSGNQFLGRRTR